MFPALTFTWLRVKKHPFGVRTEPFNVMDGWSSSSAAHTVSRDGLGHEVGGLSLGWTGAVPGQFGGRVVEGNGQWRGMRAGTDECLRVIGLRRTAGVFCGRADVRHGRRVFTGPGRVHQDRVRILLGEGLFTGPQQLQRWQAQVEESSFSWRTYGNTTWGSAGRWGMFTEMQQTLT